MNRRHAIKALAAIIPGASVRLEPEVKPSDLVVIECPRPISEAEVKNLKAALEGGLLSLSEVRDREDMRPRVLVLDDGAKLSIHRGVARVEVSDHV